MNEKYKELEYLAYHDLLTGLLNRNWFFKNKQNLEQKMFVYFMDINNLKKINENGHTEGDKHIIKCVSSVKLSDADVFIRYAGDEFVLFSDEIHTIDGDLFCTGVVEINDLTVDDAINIADKKMIMLKKRKKI
jgi:GGDEF domain-containing protein